MVDEIDQDGNGEIDFNGAPSPSHGARHGSLSLPAHLRSTAAEFVTVMSRKVNTSYTPAQVKGAFKVFERDCPSGFVSMAALEQALTTYGSEKLSLNDAQELLSQIEPDESGMVNYVEFVNMMCAGAPTHAPPSHHHHHRTHPPALASVRVPARPAKSPEALRPRCLSVVVAHRRTAS